MIVDFGEHWELSADVVLPHNELTLRRNGAEFTMAVNGTEVYKGEKPAERLRLGFGGWPVHVGDVVRFNKIKVKKSD